MSATEIRVSKGLAVLNLIEDEIKILDAEANKQISLASQTDDVTINSVYVSAANNCVQRANHLRDILRRASEQYN